AISIQASGHVNGRINQAGHTEAPEPAHHYVSKNLLHPKGRPHTDVGKVRFQRVGKWAIVAVVDEGQGDTNGGLGFCWDVGKRAIVPRRFAT
ncbi:MAG: hypothetical protein ACXU8Z_10735, partial [Caulobacteraceae bacterium]